MRNTNLFLILTIALLISFPSFAQKLFNKSSLELDDIVSQDYPQINLEVITKHTILYSLNKELYNQILNNNLHNINLEIPFFNGKTLNVDMTLFNINDQHIKVHRNTSQDIITENYTSTSRTYKINNNKDDVRGVFIFSKKGLKAVFSLDHKTYEIDLLKGDLIEQTYYLTSVQDNPIKSDFICGSNLLSQFPEHIQNSNFRSSSVSGCIEIAIEIDYQTFQTFEDYQDALDWAMEILSVASIFYLEEIGVQLKSNFAQIWETEDPYSAFIDEPNNMLFSLRDYWNNQNELVNTDRDLVHLFSKRNNTGTGGIAFLNGVNSAWNGYGFSSNLTDEDQYINLPAPYFFWNIYCVMHEIGHNFGAKHTQWCGWPEGPLDNCVNIEEVFADECTNYTNNPNPQIGTIMSYCHMWPAQSGGGIIMKFHDTVKASIMSYMAQQDLSDCNDEIIIGCLDENACNYDIDATVSQDNCIYPELYYDCDGNCLNDVDSNFICDEEQTVSLDYFINSQSIIYPNPANEYINVKADNLAVDLDYMYILNSNGAIVLMKSNMDSRDNIDVSSISAGLYTAYVINNSKIMKENIIIQ